MGARAGYTLATALFVGAAGIFGYFDWIFFLIPKAVVFPILIFVGLEITAQSFQATAAPALPGRGPGVRARRWPTWRSITLNQVLPETGKPFARAVGRRSSTGSQTVTILSGGFIVTSLLWGTALAHLIDGRMRPAAATLRPGRRSLAWFGVIHSPLPSGPIVAPARGAPPSSRPRGAREAAAYQTPYHWAAAYGAVAAGLLALGRWAHRPPWGSTRSRTRSDPVFVGRVRHAAFSHEKKAACLAPSEITPSS